MICCATVLRPSGNSLFGIEISFYLAQKRQPCAGVCGSGQQSSLGADASHMAEEEQHLVQYLCVFNLFGGLQ